MMREEAESRHEPVYLNQKVCMKEDILTESPKVNDDALQLGGVLAWKLNHDKPHWMEPVKGSGSSY